MSQAHTIQDTSPGTLETKSKRGRPKKTDDLPPVATANSGPNNSGIPLDTHDSFENKIAQAQVSGQKWIETDQAEYDYQSRSFKVKDDHFMYKNIFVTTYGKVEEIQKRLAMRTDDLWKVKQGT